MIKYIIAPSIEELEEKVNKYIDGYLAHNIKCELHGNIVETRNGWFVQTIIVKG